MLIRCLVRLSYSNKRMAQKRKRKEFTNTSKEINSQEREPHMMLISQSCLPSVPYDGLNDGNQNVSYGELNASIRMRTGILHLMFLV
mmetsp:Transcript_17569/g.48521  ORF Transcript_17569/g.48521 Transcript_17569/m.48521 type:complete len:87 (+) Transcript_17569:1547-1807(+)